MCQVGREIVPRGMSKGEMSHTPVICYYTYYSAGAAAGDCMMRMTEQVVGLYLPPTAKSEMA